ncbi:UDP-N-acetylglucosamine 2-epimerase (non-hydrolyzing) [Brevibacillus formosus]|uniref:non-hydrolyzing UDP-N-acetylglucosamine 2-epimerase n=1 Tax=Brevibacillus formosus TaxID=54913 RepID=UPI0018CE570B|nr:UDP-N-acetylglucosamine 2-epimerase (non-hydrolyzing) [Brevibacillus formosus]MBG9941034.1 UDP-N-acetylglucosamine 2-epimerase [Brevibacillus formosus]
MKKIKVMTIFGTRPEAVKLCPVILELEKNQDYIDSKVCVTAQHRDMLDQVLEVFRVNPDYDLDVMKERQTLNEITMSVVRGLTEIFENEKPDLVLVHGDTITTFLASYTAFLHQIKVGHVEAGLRTFNKQSPYPEEVNRQLVGVLADLHFVPTEWALENLGKENRTEGIYLTGNTVACAYQYTLKEKYNHPVLEWADGRKIIFLTAHRRESLGRQHSQVFRAIKRIVDEFEDLVVIFPVHPNPVIKELAFEFFNEHLRIKLVEPFDVIQWHNLLPHAHLIVTDSGGVQEEAPSFKVPTLVIRENTERPEGVMTGNLRLVGTEEDNVYANIYDLLTNQEAYKKMSKLANPYGDGKASERIVQSILHFFGYRVDKPNIFKSPKMIGDAKVTLLV